MDRWRTGALRDHSGAPAALFHGRTTAAAPAPSEPEGGAGNVVAVGISLHLGTLIAHSGCRHLLKAAIHNPLRKVVHWTGLPGTSPSRSLIRRSTECSKLEE